ncbi:MAG: hypothetical protein HC869_11030 [Rhodospirillales bacterium]|nr:hypothetical protein [Rhodospirillales bacterium]
MKRRQFLQAGSVGLAAGLATPAIAQSAPTLRWRLTTTFPKSLDTLYGACEMFSKAIGEMSDQKFQVQVFGPGEIVPPFQVFDAVSTGTVEMGNTASYYFIGKDLAFAFGTAVPFGPNTRQMNAWLTYGGGLDLLNELYKNYNVYGLPFNACYKATNELFTDIAAKNAMFKRLNDSMTAFRNEQYSWHQVCEATYDSYQIRQLSRS